MEESKQTKIKMIRPTRTVSRNQTFSTILGIPLDSRVYKLISGRFHQIPIRKFSPYVHPELYFRDLENHGQDTTNLRQLHEMRPPLQPLPIAVKKQYLIPQYGDHIQMVLKVRKGHVHVQLKNAMAILCEKKTKMPIEERVRACKEFGYPDEVLLDMMAKQEARDAASEKLDEFITTVFGEACEKKGSKKVVKIKKTIYQVLKIKKTLYAMPDEEDVVISKEDEEDNIDIE